MAVNPPSPPSAFCQVLLVVAVVFIGRTGDQSIRSVLLDEVDAIIVCSRFESFPERSIKFVNSLHHLVDVLRGIEPCHRKVCGGTCPIHPRMLKTVSCWKRFGFLP